MSKSVVVSLLGVAGLFVAAIVGVALLEPSAPAAPAERPSPPVADAPAAVPAQPSAPPAPSAPSARELAPVVPEPSEQVEVVRRSPPRPSARAQESRKQEGIAPERKAVMASMRHELMAGLEQLQQRVAPCGATDIAFTLTVESVEGGIRVVDAAVGSPEEGQETAIACARAAVAGQLLPGRAVEPGKRWQMSFTPAP